MKLIVNNAKVVLGLMLLNVFSNVAFAQPKEISQTAQIYNIPPGSVIANKLKIIDYSYKLNSLSSNTVQKKVKFTSFFEGLNLEEIKLVDSHLYNYYVNAESYYSVLSNKVISTFTLEELWHIYMFDAKLKETLLLVK